MRIVSIIILFILSSSSSNFLTAQSSGIRELSANEKKAFKKNTHRFRIGITPSSLLNEYIAIQANAAIQLDSRFQINVEYGRIIYTSTFNNPSIRGYRIRPALRYYITNFSEYRPHISLGVNIRNTTATRISNFILDDGTLSQDFAYEQDRKMIGYVFMGGVDIWLNNNIVLDLGLGFGFGRLTITDKETPANAIKEVPFLSIDRPGRHATSIIILNIRFQYAF